MDLGGFTLAYIGRRSQRLVVACIDADQRVDWIDPICLETGFGQITITRTKAAPTKTETQRLQRVFKAVVASAEAQAFEHSSLCAAESACEILPLIAPALAEAVVVAIDPSVAILDEAKRTLANLAQTAAQVYVLYDPFQPDTPAIAATDQPGLMYLKCFGFHPSILNGLSRMTLSYKVMAAMLQNEMVPGLFYKLIRERKTFRFYRIGIESALKEKGHSERALQFHRRFRNRRIAAEPSEQFASLKRRAMREAPTKTGAWVRGDAMTLEPSWPSAPGNVWMLEKTAEGMRYLSDRWERRTVGYEERDGVTLAQTPPQAYAFVTVGGDAHAPRAPFGSAPWHVVDETLNGQRTLCASMAEATLTNMARDAQGVAMFTFVGVTQAQAGITQQDVAPDGKAYKALFEKLRKARVNMHAWGKPLVVDRIRVGLLRGEPSCNEADAQTHYARVARRLVADVMATTGQGVPPLLVIVQGAGFVDNGALPALLAEARFEEDNADLRAVVATPSYPFALLPDTTSTPHPNAAAMMDELCSLAAMERHENRPWVCPNLQFAQLVTEHEIVAEFSSLDGLVLGDGFHGFRLDSATPVPQIQSVSVLSDRKVQLVLDGPIESRDPVHLTYAWGTSPDPKRPLHVANRGALRDRWSRASDAVPGQTLYRYALSGRVPVVGLK